ncbi:MAG: LysM peptidoglycan-binding domain-containing protein [Prolixibacteraceae bacterium]|nr:LysM peptidoglycan-binding domain-containing protein [Prolixibacteraceae bacterium]
MKYIGLLFFLLYFQSFCGIYAQNVTSAEVVTVDGKTFLLHEVVQGETLTSICKKYSVLQKEVVGANPQLIFGLKQGDTLKIPFRFEEKRTELKVDKTIDNTEFTYHLVKKSETIYSISRQYAIPIQSIYKYNPEAENEVLENEIIRIPKKISNVKVDGLLREDADFYFHKIQPKENLYSLARRYNSKVSSIVKYNPQTESNFEIGLIVRIPKFQEEEDEVDTIENDQYFMHRIEAGETFYSYQRRFGVSRDQLIILNPVLNDGLLAGLSIKVPTSKIKKIEVIPVDANQFNEHIVNSGETLYSLSKEYNVTVLAIKELNPELELRGLVAGETILFAKQNLIEETIGEEINEISETEIINEISPVLPEVYFKIEESEEPECRKTFSEIEDDTFRISMFLPLFYDKNDTFNLIRKSDDEIAYLDSMKYIDQDLFEKYFRIETDTLGTVLDTVLVDSLEVKPTRSLFSFSSYKTSDFINFYEGFLLAIDSMQKAGMNIRLDLYDSENNQQTIDTILYTNDFINSNLIVGPANVSLQQSVSHFSAKNQIPMVSPFSSNDILVASNPYYFQVNPSKEYALRKTSGFIGDAYYDKNFIIMTLDKYTKHEEAELVDLVRDKFFSSGVYNNLDEILFTEVDFNASGSLGYWQVKKVLKPTIENVIFIPTTYNRKEREAMLSRAINGLNVLSENFDITLIGMSDYPRFKSINTEYFHRLKLHYLTPYHVDYSNSDVNEFIASYREAFYSEPDLMSFRGYDIATFFLHAYNNLGDGFAECIEGFSTNLLQSEFNFQKVDEFGGYMNHSLFIMNYDVDYKIKVVSKITEGRVVLE